MDEKILSLEPSRGSLSRHLDSYIDKPAGGERQLALLLVEIQQGHELTAMFGNSEVESLLEEAASRMAAVCRDQDRIMRIGDMEFGLLLPEMRNEGHAMLAANKLSMALAQPFRIGDLKTTVEARIGIAMCPGHASRSDTLMRYAESALAESRSRRLPYQVYTAKALGQIAEAWELEKEMDQGMQQGEFELHFQPKIDLQTRQLSGAEALLRWRSAKRGLVQPNLFIPAATRSGQLKALTWSALNMALEQAASWSSRHSRLTVSVNLSPTLLEDTHLVDRVSDAVALWEAPPDNLILEITESAVMSHPEANFETLRHLRAKGVGVSIDDFGTGYSSLSNFRNIPATELKIDKSFVYKMLENEFDAKIVRAIIGLGQAFDLEVAAEGAESLLTLSTLAYLGCKHCQGYVISAPLPADAFVTFIDEYTPPHYLQQPND